MKKITYYLSIGVVTLMAACNAPEVEVADTSNARISFSKKDEKEARDAFAQILAKALVRKELRDFLKAKALEQFDEDYDILFHAQKNQIVTDNTTFFDILASYNSSKQDLIDITESLPKLTILIPELLNERYYNSAATWDTEHFIPKVAFFHINDDRHDVTAYDSKGKGHKIKAKGDPDELILVVKDNERIEVSDVSPSGLRVSSNKYTEKAQWDYLMTDNGRYYYYQSINFNKSKRSLRSQINKRAKLKAIGIDFNVGSDSPEYRSHLYRPEAPRGYAYYKTYYSNGQLMTNMSELFPGQLDYTVKDRIGFLRFLTDGKIQDISENWAEGNLELTGRVLIAGRVPESFTSRSFGNISFERLAAQFTVPGFAEQVESGWGSVCVPNTFWGCHTVNPYQDKFNEYRNNNTLFDNRGSSANSGIWLDWRGAEIFTWDAEDYGNKAILFVLEKDGNVTHTEERTWSVGLTAAPAKKDGSNLSFTGNIGGKSTVSWLDGDDNVFEQQIDYNGQYGAFKPPVSTGNTEFILRVY
ncbi:hypothetical protein G8759_28335 [Spirosoma aureum]|uniref:Uncharacterized protein n=1 Tax=Spirosoma aureum TaxID=2692134 RepID=A0A6G9AV41_9BACT|nr:hypothetical protein [Spirosoma aureum]QIP16270.1 hypothetical protein G8759_28335 [Spirosoma aureum]